jgi:hypothetical protein
MHHSTRPCATVYPHSWYTAVYEAVWIHRASRAHDGRARRVLACAMHMLAQRVYDVESKSCDLAIARPTDAMQTPNNEKSSLAFR